MKNARLIMLSYFSLVLMTLNAWAVPNGDLSDLIGDNLARDWQRRINQQNDNLRIFGNIKNLTSYLKLGQSKTIMVFIPDSGQKGGTTATNSLLNHIRNTLAQEQKGFGPNTKIIFITGATMGTSANIDYVVERLLHKEVLKNVKVVGVTSVDEAKSAIKDLSHTGDRFSMSSNMDVCTDKKDIMFVSTEKNLYDHGVFLDLYNELGNFPGVVKKTMILGADQSLASGIEFLLASQMRGTPFELQILLEANYAQGVEDYSDYVTDFKKTNSGAALLKFLIQNPTILGKMRSSIRIMTMNGTYDLTTFLNSEEGVRFKTFVKNINSEISRLKMKINEKKVFRYNNYYQEEQRLNFLTTLTDEKIQRVVSAQFSSFIERSTMKMQLLKLEARLSNSNSEREKKIIEIHNLQTQMTGLGVELSTQTPAFFKSIMDNRRRISLGEIPLKRIVR